MKTIGVLGGQCPQATLDLATRVHAATQRRIPQAAPGDYPSLVIYYYRPPPAERAGAGPRRPAPRPDPRLVQAVTQLGALADFLVIAAPAPHQFQAALEHAAGRPILGLIDLVLDAVQERHWTRVGVLGRDPALYRQGLARRGKAVVSLADHWPDLRDRLDLAIGALTTGPPDAPSRAVAEEAVAVLRAQRVDGIILSCPEMPLLLGDAANAADLLNPAELLADAAVCRAMA
ncbi:MAG TPA: aspartate/glutamate racemase family protein [Chloroflexia bacterium]|nr:aspartate/glutamate racemase family protein [Chloroflexia bacterium]